MVKEWIKVSFAPAVLRHTWGKNEDSSITPVRRGGLIEFNETDCILAFYGSRVTCPCGLYELGRL